MRARSPGQNLAVAVAHFDYKNFERLDTEGQRKFGRKNPAIAKKQLTASSAFRHFVFNFSIL